MKRLAEFIRSVIPEDSWQLLYLVGALFLFLSPRLSWYFGHLKEYSLVVVALTPVVMAGIFAYYGCFRAGARPMQRIAVAVFLPTLLGIGLIIGESTFFNERNQSVFVRRFGLAAFLDECALAFRQRPTGLSLALIALAMMGVFSIRMYLGISSLPLRLGGRMRRENDSAEPWNNLQMLIFVLVCPLFLLDRFLGILFSIPNSSWYIAGVSGLSIYIVLTDALRASLLVLVAILILGKSGRESAQSSLQLASAGSAFLGLALPFLISLMISTLQFVYDRPRKAWSTQFGDYFSLGGAWRWALVLMVFGAFAEEVVFRGMLLRPLLRRYGLHRGIWFTGLIWAAFHFHGEMHQRYTMEQALLQLASRIAICLAMNYVLSWMTLRWNSVIPAGIAHTVSNVLVASGINGGIPFAHELRIALWAVCAVVLFRYWPPAEMGAAATEPAGIPIQPEAGHIE